MKRYEGLFILNPSVLNPVGKDGKDDGLKDAIDKISAELTTAGAKIETESAPPVVHRAGTWLYQLSMAPS